MGLDACGGHEGFRASSDQLPTLLARGERLQLAIAASVTAIERSAGRLGEPERQRHEILGTSGFAGDTAEPGRSRSSSQ
jgi:hypothetical protein